MYMYFVPVTGGVWGLEGSVFQAEQKIQIKQPDISHPLPI
jgi:hypothetical protein